MKPLIIYHADCTDGFGAAFAAWKKFGDTAEYLPMHYKKEYGENDIPNPYGREVYILDFSFPRPVMEALFRDAKRAVWLDHHRTGFEMWCPGEFEFYAENENDDSKNQIILDNNKSGALIAWRYFQPEVEVPDIIKHIDDRDRWQFKLEGSREIHAALGAERPWKFERWDSLINKKGSSLLHERGEAILASNLQQMESILKKSIKCVIKTDRDIEGISVNSIVHISELGSLLAQKSGTYGLIWYLDGSTMRANCSLRSIGDYDVSAIAKFFGGGGHKNAAGFTIEISTLLSWIV